MLLCIAYDQSAGCFCSYTAWQCANLHALLVVKLFVCCWVFWHVFFWSSQPAWFDSASANICIQSVLCCASRATGLPVLAICYFVAHVFLFTPVLLAQIHMSAFLPDSALHPTARHSHHAHSTGCKTYASGPFPFGFFCL